MNIDIEVRRSCAELKPGQMFRFVGGVNVYMAINTELNLCSEYRYYVQLTGAGTGNMYCFLNASSYIIEVEQTNGPMKVRDV